MLGRGETSIRRCSSSFWPPAAELGAARRGEFSTNELVRRGKAEIQRLAGKQQANAQRERKQALDGAKLISDWRIKELIYGSDGERIVDEVRREFALRQQYGSASTGGARTMEEPASKSALVR